MAGYEDDAATVRRVLAGEVEAFAALVERWQGPLVNLAYRYCRDRSIAEDMAQEAFLKIYRGLPRWRQDSRFSTWMFAVAINQYRSMMRRTGPPAVPVEELERVLAAGDLDAEADAALRRDAVHRAVGSLPPKYRDVVLLFYFQEMDLQETAQVARLPEGTVKARLFRARKLLQDKLGGLLSVAPIAEEA